MVDVFTLSPEGNFATVRTPYGMRTLYHHHTNSISGQQPDWYWEWVCDKCGARFSNRALASIVLIVKEHSHE